MGVIFASTIAAILLAIATGAVLYNMQEPVYRAQPLSSVRVGDPGHNLVGPNWSGNNRVADDGTQEPET